MASPLERAKIIRRDPSIRSKDSFQMLDKAQWVLSLAAKKGHLEVVQLLCETDPALSTSIDKMGRTPLHYASVSGDLEVASYLMGKLDDHWDKDENSWTALYFAAIEGHASIVELFLGHPKPPINERTKAGELPIHGASRSGHVAVVKCLLEHMDKKDMNATDNMYGRTALHAAAQQGHAEVVKLLLAQEADQTMKDTNGRTALEWAILSRHEHVMELLLPRNECNLEKRCWAEDIASTALFLAATRGERDTVEALITLLVSMHAKVKFGRTAHLLAAQNGWSDIVDLLKVAGAGLDSSTGGDLHGSDQKTVDFEYSAVVGNEINLIALHIAAQYGNVDLVKEMVIHPVDIQAKDKSGKTPLYLAVQNGHREVAQILLYNEAKVNEKTIAGRTALRNASTYHFGRTKTLCRITF